MVLIVIARITIRVKLELSFLFKGCCRRKEKQTGLWITCKLSVYIKGYRLKCFAFGKKVRRQIEEDGQTISRVEILKRRFQKL